METQLQDTCVHETGLRLLHTSDWHLGRALYGRRRDQEFDALMDWMIATVRAQSIDVVIIAGDVFDTTTPGVRAQTQYYNFLQAMRSCGCRHVIVVAGNHDSSSFLQAPAPLLRTLGVHVVGDITRDADNQVILLRDPQGTPELIVCAVPYLRDRDVRTAQAGQDTEARERALVDGVRAHYAQIADQARALRDELGMDIPIVATGHLHTAGSSLREGDGVRELYIGTLGHVPANVFDPVFDYVALGHLHIPQRVGGEDRIRYSGAPVAMGFGESNHQKSVSVVTFESRSEQDEMDAGFEVKVQPVTVPKFQTLHQVEGDISLIEQRLRELCAQNEPCWVEVLHTGTEIVGNLRERVAQIVDQSPVDVLRIRLAPRRQMPEQGHDPQELLQDLDVDEVFERCLEVNEVPLVQRDSLRSSYHEVLAHMHQGDDET